MKRVYTDPNIVRCDLFRSMLGAARIESMFKNEAGSAWTGYGYPVPSGSALPWAWPEVWVNDEDFDMASQIAADFKSGNEANA